MFSRDLNTPWVFVMNGMGVTEPFGVFSSPTSGGLNRALASQGCIRAMQFGGGLEVPLFSNRKAIMCAINLKLCFD